MSINEQHVALPKLYGAPAYARPPTPATVGPRPFDPDDLPIEASQSPDERELTAHLPARAWAPGGAVLTAGAAPTSGGDAGDGRKRRRLGLRTIAGQLLGNDDS
ncbi:MAG: hypothetical protein WKF56_03705 [Candidatus Limnocylindrales bacterium]